MGHQHTHYVIMCHQVLARTDKDDDWKAQEIHRMYLEIYRNARVQEPQKPPETAAPPKPGKLPPSNLPPLASQTIPSRLTIRVFPKNTFGHEKMAALRRELPADVDVKSGTSIVDQAAPVDILLVNSNVIRPADVLLVLEAFQRIGSPMKSVQPIRIKKNQEIQAGTITSGEGESESGFANLNSLNLSRLRKLANNPDKFWAVARNGKCYESAGPSYAREIDC